MKDHKEAVRAGAKLLDEKKPDWFQKVDLDTLFMSNCQRCVLGQVFEDYYDGLRILHGLPLEAPMDEEGIGTDLGFYTPDWLSSGSEWRELGDLWIEEIKARFDKGFDI